jgi:hypothetical protein
MKLRCALCLAILLCLTTSRAEVRPGNYDLATVRDASTLETLVLEEWHPSAKDPSIRQKLIEITVCEWWAGQKVRLPVSFSAPAAGGPCQNIIVGNMGLVAKPGLPGGAMLRLLKERGVGIVLIGMTTVDAMPPIGALDVGMKANLLKTKDMRYTPAWIWGLSDMRALTAALVEKEVFQPLKVLATGGSKCGVATAAAGIADARFTAILPYAAPIIDSPGGPYIEGMMPATITELNAAFLAASTLPVREALASRQQIRAHERLTLREVHDAGWSETEISDACTAAWEVCRLTNYLPQLQQRGLEIFYIQGSNDNVSPGLLNLCKRFPGLPMTVLPGVQHGGAKEAGFMKQVGSQPELQDSLYAFAQHHFFNTRPMVAAPTISQHWDKASQRLQVTVSFPDHSEPQTNQLWWSIDRHPDYTLQMEYDTWQSVPLHATGPATFAGEVQLQTPAHTLDFISVHSQTTAGSTLTLSGPLSRITVE